MSDTSEIRVYGASDDLLEFDGAVRDEGSSYDQPIYGKLTDPAGESCLVVGVYTPAGTWAIGIAQTEEDVQVPAWALAARYRQPVLPDETAYSCVLLIDAPVGTELEILS